MDEFIRSDIKALQLHFFFPQQVHGTIYTCNMFGDFYSIGRNAAGRRNFKNHFLLFISVVDII